MSVSKDELIAAIRQSAQDIEEIALSLSDEALLSGVYESGWNARQLLCHLTAGGSFASFMIVLAQQPPDRAQGAEATFDQDAWNASEVASRAGKSVAELMNELRSSSERSVAAAEAAPDALLQGPFRAPWGDDGTLAEVIVRSINGHAGAHLGELKAAVA
jgi:hypothetical protein